MLSMREPVTPDRDSIWSLGARTERSWFREYWVSKILEARVSAWDTAAS